MCFKTIVGAYVFDDKETPQYEKNNNNIPILHFIHFTRQCTYKHIYQCIIAI